MKRALHFVGFVPYSQHFWNAVRVFGLPDFLHRVYDGRCVAEYMPGDVMLFAKGCGGRTVQLYSYDDSEFN